MLLKLTGASSYCGPHTGGAAAGKILQRGDTYEFTDEAAEAVLKLTAYDAHNNVIPLFTKVKGPKAAVVEEDDSDADPEAVAGAAPEAAEEAATAPAPAPAPVKAKAAPRKRVAQ